ncbi:cdc42 effector protein 1 [Triplophysa dalaica]|uniref:cdc42 effector protein 1 n=1 Tax=Triplophysa dalaica TaxID=1582913 RepID=UPI0024E011DF|nr:cdc42 effector protein 1 [Triplophysa dalaica]XP_056627490.1 cdc42 effector protein 1 [Triplophysa dalaica]XP_056627491.1 cdc42 effector protein 1 [Triplophysa dalaica]XP_056627492.1 cdc42 effector protein 1 [Triplophysa dalaica]
MNLGKLSGLKGLVSHSSGKRRFKGDLTLDMISPPLGDFRHTMHVGRGGDVFGDTSFLSNHGGAGNNTDGDSSSTSEKNEGFFSRTLRHVRRTPDRPHGGYKDLSPPPPPISPIIKNAISLPRLDVDSPNGCPVKVLFPSTPKTPENSTYMYGLESGFVTLPRLSRTERQSQGSFPPSCPPEIHRGSLTDTGISCLPCSDSVSPSDSMNSFTFDLGPSLMSEVFAMIDSPVCEKSISFSETTCEPALGSTDDDVDSDATTSLVDSLLREDSDGRTRLYGGEWKHLDFVNGESPKKSKVGDVMFSDAVEDHGMEPEHFQRAADVLARHYGGGLRNADANSSHRRPYNYPDEEEEIKV